jgi:TatD DNase family protein
MSPGGSEPDGPRLSRDPPRTEETRRSLCRFFQLVSAPDVINTDDFEAMLERSRAAGVKSMIITGGSLKESKEALTLAKQHGGCLQNDSWHSSPSDPSYPLSGLYATVGCHPTRSTEFDKYRGGPGAYLQDLDELIENNLEGEGRVVAIGECGLGRAMIHLLQEFLY